MTRSGELATSLEFSLLLKGILSEWKENANLTYSELAEQLAVEDDSLLRSFLSEKRLLQQYRSDNSLVAKITSFLEVSVDSVRPFISDRRYYQYLMMTSETGRGFEIYRRRDPLRRVDNASLEAFYKIANDYFGANPYDADEKVFPLIEGNYYCYRSSSFKGAKPYIVKSHLSILKAAPNTTIFRHLHPDRHHKTGVRANPKPRETVGVVVCVENHLYFIANAGANQGITYFAMRRPYDYDFNFLFGFVVTPSTSRTIVAARTVFGKDENALPEGIERIPNEVSDPEKMSAILGFDVKVLRDDDSPFLATTITTMDEALYS